MSPILLVTPVEVSLCTTITALMACAESCASLASISAGSAPWRQSPGMKSTSMPQRAAICRHSVAKWPVSTIRTLSPGESVLTIAASQAPVPDEGKIITGPAVLKIFWQPWNTAFASSAKAGLRGSPANAAEKFEIEKTDAEWRAQLTPQQYEILRKEGTERPGSSPLLKEHRKGTFACAGCDLPLFSSETKFESGTGWPSFYQPLENAVGKTEDRTFGMLRTEIHCRRCGGHLGHVFDDGPKPTGLRYCMDGFALLFHPAAPTAS